MRIQHNLNAMNSLRQLGTNNNNTGKNLEKLSSGYKINRAGDDAAGLAISEKMRGQIKGLEQAQSNANDGISLIQTAEGGLNETHAILQRMRELAVQSANGTSQDAVDRENINKEVTALRDEIDRISESTNFNKINLLDGNLGGYKGTFDASGSNIAHMNIKGGGLKNTTIKMTTTSGAAGNNLAITSVSGNSLDTSGITFTKADGSALSGMTKAGIYTIKANVSSGTSVANKEKYEGLEFTIAVGEGGLKGSAASGVTFAITGSSKGVEFQIGADNEPTQQVKLDIGDMSTKGLAINTVNVSTQDGAKSAITSIDNAINTVSASRADLGALQNRLEHTVNNLGVTSENLSAAESRIRDVDMAKEMMEYTKNNILSQAAQSMLAQANQQPQGVLQLLQ